MENTTTTTIAQENKTKNKNAKNKKGVVCALISGVLVLGGIAAAIWAAIACDGKLTNLFQIVGSMICVIASGILAAISFWQNRQYKKLNDDTDEQFHKIENGIFVNLREMRELLSYKARPILLPDRVVRFVGNINPPNGVIDTNVAITYKLEADCDVLLPRDLYNRSGKVTNSIKFNTDIDELARWFFVVRNRGTAGIYNLTMSNLAIKKFDSKEDDEVMSQIVVEYSWKNKPIPVLKENEGVVFEMKLPFDSGNMDHRYRIEMFFEMSDEEGSPYITKQPMKWDFTKTEETIYGEYECQKPSAPTFEPQSEMNECGEVRRFEA
jgi:hypothetical protein